PHALTAHLGLGDLDTAFLADDTAMLHALVLAAQAFVVLHRPEDAGTEQAVTFRLERAVVDGFGLLDFTERPRANRFRGSQSNPDGDEFVDGVLSLEPIEQSFHVLLSAGG